MVSNNKNKYDKKYDKLFDLTYFIFVKKSYELFVLQKKSLQYRLKIYLSSAINFYFL